MSYKTILVHLDNSASCAGRVAVALDLATRFDAHLVGLVVTVEPVVPTFVMAQIPSSALESQREALRTKADEAIAAFETAAQKAGCSVETRRALAFNEEVPETLALHARYADLVVMGQHDPDDANSLGVGTLEQCLLGTGRPVLVVPYIGAPAGFGRKVLLAWDASREAARAASDALPLMEQAEKVTVLTINPKKGRGAHGEEPGADIALAIARHGVKAEAESMAVRDVSIDEALLSRLSDDGADLLVMGCYGHARLRELVLGGTTRHILQHMTVPTLMTH
ncbi:universal stress protein [Algihabitans albus]|uniref:universal stress protein n=1 Tax=Algihabitans albus TaxID=2164067 RepID=UPI000E5C7B02|nr:universal stress protein [Algihabitans albus]